MRNVPDTILDIEYIDEDQPYMSEKIDEKRKTRKKIGVMEKLWAYLTLKQLLDQYELKEENTGELKNDTIKEKALELALKVY